MHKHTRAGNMHRTADKQDRLERNNKNDMLTEVYLELASLTKAKKKQSDSYRMLKIMESVMEYFDEWDDNDTEMTVYRRFARLVDILFKETAVKLKDLSKSTKSSLIDYLITRASALAKNTERAQTENVLRGIIRRTNVEKTNILHRIFVKDCIPFMGSFVI
ncbi:hypothetical protein BD770DRAFT_423467 [Pilaira anomala]|nr:hypothetical protein BD770DRAFT_423467 [Pilaira anomala]